MLPRTSWRSGLFYQPPCLSAVEQLVCEIAAERWRAGKRVLIACEDEKQAIRLDEALWA
ncbi:DNA polymerase III subunit chi, partial [Salmonella enterica subsp. enterica serovar Muenster]|nr:DNA polymerase III subunit chi [Salmonella enterica subsp. enterica serovar Muenster]